MNFSVNSPILFVLAGIIILAVLLQSVFFLVRAVRRSKEIGMDQQKLRKTMVTAGVFTIAPAVAIVISVITLSKDLGLPLPWLRLSVVGSLSYETIAATNAESAMGLTFGQVSALTASQYVTIAWVMTISIMLGIWLVPLIGKKLQGGMTKIENRDKRWGDILSSALFIGMIAAFLGYVFSDVMNVTHGDFSGLIPVLVMLTSAVVMVICGVAAMRTKKRWIQDYALPISMLCGMAVSIPLTNWLS